jgi:hypothetical protein
VFGSTPKLAVTCSSVLMYFFPLAGEPPAFTPDPTALL